MFAPLGNVAGMRGLVSNVCRDIIGSLEFSAVFFLWVLQFFTATIKFDSSERLYC